VPEIQVVERYVPLPPGLLALQENPVVPRRGDNGALLAWALQCAANNRQLNEQIRALQELDQ
jgi:hypothetical protein